MEVTQLEFLCIGGALFFGEGTLHFGRGSGKLFGMVAGLVLFGLVHWLVHVVRRSDPMFLAAGVDGRPGSPVRRAAQLGASVVVFVLGAAVMLRIVAFLGAVTAMLIGLLTNDRTLGLLIGIPLAFPLVWGYYKLVPGPRMRRMTGVGRRPSEAALVHLPAGATGGGPVPPPSASPSASPASLDAADDPVVYQAYFGRGVGLLLPLGASAFFGLVAWFLLSISETVVGLLSVGMAAAGGVSVLFMAVRQGLALRVDAFGVALGWRPMGRTVPGRIAPWAEIEAVVMFAQVTGANRTTYVGLMRRDGLPPLPGGPGPRSFAWCERLIPDIPREVIASSVPVSGWSLDVERLHAAIERNAPGVPLLDLRC